MKKNRSGSAAHCGPWARIGLCMLVLAVAAAAGLCAAAIRGDLGAVRSPAQPALASASASAPAAADLPDGLETDTTPLQLTDIWILGTHIGLTGKGSGALPASASLVLCGDGGSEAEWPLQLTKQSGGYSFTLSDNLNDGIDIQTLSEGEGCLLVRGTQADGTVQLFALTDETGVLPLETYTLTRNESNLKITLSSQTCLNGGTMESLVLGRTACTLPENVYDVVLDAGHGGSDGGTVSGGYSEADIVLDLAFRTKKKLEALGLKVLLTRDGTEPDTEMMAYTMYDENGRVNVAAGSGAKLCLSLHLNSYDGYLEHGGVQIYTAAGTDTAFAEQLAAGVVRCAGTYTSPMQYYEVGDGVYCRTFSESDLDEMAGEAAERGFEPYAADTSTTYYYIIRELGGRITGAYIDGRDPHYGTNLYCDSSVGVESYLCELGYMTLDEDLDNLLQNADGYAQGLAEAVAGWYGLAEAG